MISNIDHIEIEASDATEMSEFLQKLGYELHRETDHHGKSYELKPPEGDGPIFEIHTVSGEEVPGINHIAFETDDPENVAERLREQDVDDVVDPYYVERTGRVITNFRDPDGRRFQAVRSAED
jgi:glyoxylase I family protein